MQSIHVFKLICILISIALIVLGAVEVKRKEKIGTIRISLIVGMLIVVIGVTQGLLVVLLL